MGSVMAVDLAEHERTRTEVWTRVMGYHRPVCAFNPGKQAEHAERRMFIEPCMQALGDHPTMPGTGHA